MTDVEILASVQSDPRFVQDPGLGDIFSDVGDVFSDTWDSIVGNTKEEVGKTVESGIKKAFGNDEGGQQTPYDQMSQTALPQQPTPTETKFKNSVAKVPPVIVGAGTTVLVKYVGKFGWITSIAAGAVAGGAKYYFIDKKQGV